MSLASSTPNSCCGPFITQNASVHVQFQLVTLGLNWKFTPTDTAASKPWEGGCFGGHVGGAWGNDTNANYSGSFFSCFTATTQILMADGTTRPIAAVKIGDEVVGENGEVNRVVDIETPVLGSRKLYAFNDGPAFVTPEHPFMTRAGWKSIAPEATFAENGDLSVGALKVGDEVVRWETVTTRAKPMPVAFGGMVQSPPMKAIRPRWSTICDSTGITPISRTTISCTINRVAAPGSWLSAGLISGLTVRLGNTS